MRNCLTHLVHDAVGTEGPQEPQTKPEVAKSLLPSFSGDVFALEKTETVSQNETNLTKPSKTNDRRRQTTVDRTPPQMVA